MSIPSIYTVFKKSKNLRQRQSTKPSYCPLEDRKLLAGMAALESVTLNPFNSVLRIEGSDAADSVFVVTPSETEVRINFNGEACTFLRSDVSQIRFRGLGGDDVFGGALSDIPVVAIGGEGNDRLVGGSGADRLLGDAGDDVIIGGGSSDNLLGGSGSDFLQGSGGNDSLTGGDGDDTLLGGSGEDVLRGDAGDDFAAGGTGDDLILGGNDNDTLLGELGNDTLNGNAGNDQLSGNEGDDGLFGGNGDDSIFGQDGLDRINGNDGTDFLSGGVGDDFLQGGEGDDQINGDGGADTIFGRDGNDTLIGNGGVDIIFGGAGNDLIQGGFGGDTLAGGTGADIIDGDGGADIVFGGDGDDLIRGGDQNDFLFGQTGSDTVLGMNGNDRVVGNEGSDFLNGGGGDDIVVGNDGNDRLFGSAGDDELRGGDGNDGLFGGLDGNDRLFGDAGSDRLLAVDGAEIIAMDVRDARVEFRNGTGVWSEAEITAIDDGLNRLQTRIGNNRLARDPVISDSIVFLKENTLPADVSISTTQVAEFTTFQTDPATGQRVDVTNFERRILFADWDESDSAANELRTLEVPRAISLAWVPIESVTAVVPSASQTFNRFTQLSAWRTTPAGDFFRSSEDNMFFYREDAVFADETGRINPTQDWASAWQLAFTPGQTTDNVGLISKLSVLDQLFTALEIF